MERLTDLRIARIMHGILDSAEPEDKMLLHGDKSGSAAESLAEDRDLQSALLNCAAELVNFAQDKCHPFPELTCMLGQEVAVIQLWHAAGLFWRHLSNLSPYLPMPESVADFLAFIRSVPILHEF